MTKPTPHQRKLLRELADGAEIEVSPYGAWITSGATVRPQTVTAIAARGWIKVEPAHRRAWVITDAGREAIG